jgi:hypothetical protein
VGGRKRGDQHIIPLRHGTLSYNDKRFTDTIIYLEVFLPGDTTLASAEAMSDLQGIFSNQDFVTIDYDDPFAGNIQAAVDLIEEPVQTQDRFTYLFALHNPSGMWEDVTASNAVSANPPSVTTGGNRPIDDMVFTFAGTGFIEHTDTLGNANRLTIDAAAGAGTYIVDCGARTVQKAAVDQDAFLTVSREWPTFDAGTAQSFTSDVAVEVDWRNKWA